jgi:hypothetical protein
MHPTPIISVLVSCVFDVSHHEFMMRASLNLSTKFRLAFVSCSLCLCSNGILLCVSAVSVGCSREGNCVSVCVLHPESQGIEQESSQDKILEIVFGFCSCSP